MDELPILGEYLCWTLSQVNLVVWSFTSHESMNSWHVNKAIQKENILNTHQSMACIHILSVGQPEARNFSLTSLYYGVCVVFHGGTS